MALELRWFIEGEIPTKIFNWLERILANAFPAAESQPDLYLFTSGCDEIGIKLRKGAQENLEIKLRNSAYDFETSNKKMNGTVEDWIKLGWREAKLKPKRIIESFFEELPKGHWARVPKNRRKFYCHVFPDGSVKPTLDTVDRGISWELVDFTINDNSWWSIAFDAVGDEKEQMRILQQGVDWVLEDYDGPHLTKSISYGYPKWLSEAF